MTVGELIEELKKQNPSKRVVVINGGEWTRDVDEVVAAEESSLHDAPVEIWIA